MPITQPTYTYDNAQLTLVFNYMGGNWSFTMYPDASVYASLTDAQFDAAINGIMSQLRVLAPTGEISCDVSWLSNSTNGGTRVTYTG